MGTTAAELKLCTIQGIVRLCPPWDKGHRHTVHMEDEDCSYTYTHNDTGSGNADRQGQEEGAAA